MKRRSKVLLVLSAVLLLLGAVVGWQACGPVRRPDGGWGLLAAQQRAPGFRLQDQNGREHSLSDYAGRAVVLFFYPRDGTPGCTREACAFRDAWTRIEATGAQLLGVSTDDVASHLRFAQSHRLQFPLLADTQGEVATRYGVNRILGMASRVTFLIAPDGRVARVYPSVDPAVHADEVIAALQQMAPTPASTPVSSEPASTR